MSAQNLSAAINFGYTRLEDAFPQVDPDTDPLGGGVLIQIRRTATKTAGGLELPTEVLDAEKQNTQVGKVIAVGPLAFHHRTTLEPWAEGAWVKPGDYVRIARFNGFRFTVKWMDPAWRPAPARKRDEEAPRDKQVPEEIGFVIFEDHMLIARVRDPLAVTSYL